MTEEVSLDEYKLSYELIGHSLDVRSVAEAGNFLVSGSRDKTVKIWENDSGSFKLLNTYKNHTNFVAYVYYLEEEKLICSGSNDTTICLFKEGSLEPFVVLKGHTSTVCALSKGLQSGTIVSGSWDKTARVWNVSNGTTLLTLVGHEAAVWSVVCLKNEKYATGSADKNIFIWNTKGEKVMVLKGHQDCVRALLCREDGALISAGNDAVIRLWNVEEGDCIREIYGHDNYIYTISVNPHFNNDIIVSGGEDNTIRMWDLKSGKARGNSITLPAQSVWSVAVLANGDIAAGSSDAVVRIFTKDPQRIADAKTLENFEVAVNTRKLEASKELGGVKMNELPGPESLLQPGKEGQTRIVRQPNGKVFCYQWTNNEWKCLGDVVGASGGTQETAGKKLFEGKEYDYIFNVDISDDTAPLKLPYNRGEDPWHAAQAFIHKNNLPQVYLDQVANFIVKNADAPITQKTSSEYVDPFTGGSRYTPGSGSSNGFNPGGNLIDPFTGGSSYRTEAARTEHNVPNEVEMTDVAKHFPTKRYLTFDVCDPKKILEKIKEFNSKNNDASAIVSEDVLQAAVTLTNNEPKVDKLAIEALQILLRWSKDILFPVLDIARLAVRNEQVASILVTNEILNTFIENISSSPANQLMSVRAVSNLMTHQSGRQLVSKKLPMIFELISKIHAGSPNMQIALATFYLNLTISQMELADAEVCRILAEGILDLLKWIVAEEAMYRSIAALGNLTCTPHGTITTAQLMSVDYVMDKIRSISDNPKTGANDKLCDCAKALISAL